MTELVKALHTSIFATSVAILGLYVPALLHSLSERPKHQAWFLMCGIVMTWAGAAATYGWLSWLYWSHQVEPSMQGNTPHLLRLLWPALLLTGGAFHISASQTRRLGVWPTFVVWSTLVAVATLVMASIG
jgi:hypothetical protein